MKDYKSERHYALDAKPKEPVKRIAPAIPRRRTSIGFTLYHLAIVALVLLWIAA